MCRWFEISASLDEEIDDHVIRIDLTEIDENGKEADNDLDLHDYIYLPEFEYDPNGMSFYETEYKSLFEKTLKIAKKSGIKEPRKLAKTLNGIILDFADAV